MNTLLRSLSGVFFLLALMALAFLVLSDVRLGFQTNGFHPRAEALALIFIGASFVCLQMRAGVRSKTRLKSILLGLAFVLWGLEQFLAPGPGVNAIDCAVITIFVVDLGLVIKGSLGRQTADVPHDDASKD
jgi:hypothetical protein